MNVINPSVQGPLRVTRGERPGDEDIEGFTIPPL